MSCGNFSSGGGNYSNDHCVVSVVKRILKAQHKAVQASDDTCLTSCDRSIADLLSEFEPNRRRLRHNTIPFILYCKENCKPFIASGVVRKFVSATDSFKFECIESPIFRVKNFVDGSDSCVILELLKPVYATPAENTVGKGSHHKGDSVCGFFKGKHVENFKATNICITVDLSCFCGITCLDPITPIRSVRGEFEC